MFLSHASPPPRQMSTSPTPPIEVTAMVLVTHLQATHEWYTLFFFCVDIQTGPHSLSLARTCIHLLTSSPTSTLLQTTHSTKQQVIQQQTQTPASMFSTYPGQVVVDHPVKVPIEHRFDPYVDNGGYVPSFLVHAASSNEHSKTQKRRWQTNASWLTSLGIFTRSKAVSDTLLFELFFETDHARLTRVYSI